MLDALPALLTDAAAEPDVNELTARYAAFERDLDGARSGAAWAAVFREWDDLRRSLSTWANVTQLRFDRDTNDPAARAARERLDDLDPKLTALDHRLKQRFVDGGSNQRGALPDQAYRLWENDLAAFDPAIEDDLAVEARLKAAYASCVASIQVSYGGETLNLAGLQKFAQDPDRSVRHDAAALRWSALGERGPELDRIYDEMVHVRDRMARTLGYRNYTGLAYRLMQRVGYGEADVARWREAIVTHVTPLAVDLVARARRLHGVDRIALWDERLLLGPEPAVTLGGADWLMEQAKAAFTELHPDLGSFAAMMEREQLLDLMTRPGKAGGGHCTFIPAAGVPYVFGNLNGNRSDVTTLVHELGHAFQVYNSRALPALDCVWPTHEGAEIHSMGLEFLAAPQMERFFGDGADAFRAEHLADGLMLLPYAAAIDHFQHDVYARPQAGPNERHAMWKQLEAHYMPWRSYGDLERPNAGAFWQAQLHVYKVPFYYIDYTLAQCCALQLWELAGRDPSDALDRYLKLCRLGGSLAFGDLVASAGLASPFGPDALPRVVARARRELFGEARA